MMDASARAAERLNGLAVRRPDVVRLARLASMAVRVEPHLLRRLRRACAPEADVGVESDVWFCPLVESRGATAIVLQAAVVEILRDDLATDRTTLARVVALTAEAHARSAPALRLEERIVGIALLERGGGSATVRIDMALRPALRALNEGEARAREIAGWWLRAAPRMPREVWEADNAMALLLGASAVLGQRPQLASYPAPVGELARLAWALPAAPAVPDLDVELELAPDRLRFRAPTSSGAIVRVPATSPPVIEVSWTTRGQRRRAVAEVAGDGELNLEGEADDVTVQTLRGVLYRVLREGTEMSAPESRTLKKSCFVLMGFGEKTNASSGTPHTVDVGAVYESLVKPAVVAAGLDCVRLDEIGTADFSERTLYEMLLGVDIVIADVSNGDANTFYELGVRHALRPRTTILIREADATTPFDINHFAILPYERPREDGTSKGAPGWSELTNLIARLLTDSRTDSPVYASLPDLVAPRLAVAPVPSEVALERAGFDSSLAEADAALKAGNFEVARGHLAQLLAARPDDDRVRQGLARATFLSGRLSSPTERACRLALAVLEPLHPTISVDAETLLPFGLILAALWRATHVEGDLEAAIRALERCFSSSESHYAGLRLAFLLNERARLSSPADAVTDYVLAQRVRHRVIAICQQMLETSSDSPGDPGSWFSPRASLAEAYLGLGDSEQARRWREATRSTYSGAPWMVEMANAQFETLPSLLEPSPLRFLASGGGERGEKRK